MKPVCPTLQGVWLPLITPFRDGALDEVSLRRCARHFAAEPIDGLILGATTGEGLTLDDEEAERLVSVAAEELANTGTPIPLCLGLSGSDTRKGVKALERTAAWAVDGYLIACPYYTRVPAGTVQAFLRSGRHYQTPHPDLQHPLPHGRQSRQRNDVATGRAREHRGRQGLLRRSGAIVRPAAPTPLGFAVLTGEDALFYGALTQGADGGILASAHVETRAFVSIRSRLLEGEQARAGGLAPAMRPSAAAVFRAESGADQALAVARRPDRQPGSAVADDDGQRGTRRPNRS